MTYFKVGLVVFISFILFAVLLLNTSDSPWSTRGDTIRVRFDFVNDLRVGATTQLSGVGIGKVTAVDLLPDGSKVEVTLSVDHAFQRLRKNVVVEIGVIGFVGEAYIKFTNRDLSVPHLSPDDLPLIGVNPVGLGDLLTDTQHIIRDLAEMTKNVNQLVEENRDQVSEALRETRQLVWQTEQSISRITAQTDRTLKMVDDTISESRETLTFVNNSIDQLTSQLTELVDDGNKLVEKADHLLDQNTPKVNNAVIDFQMSAENLKKISDQLDRELNRISDQVSELLHQTNDFVKTETPKIDQLTTQFTETATEIRQTNNALKDLVDRFQNGDGTFAQLLDNSEPLKEIRVLVKNTDETVRSVKDLSQRFDQRTKSLDLPKLKWNYELRAIDDHLRNELGFLILKDQDRRSYGKFGLNVREDQIKFDLEFAFGLTRFLDGRVGFYRSEPMIGIDLLLFERSLGLSLEANRLTAKTPELSSEIFWRFIKNEKQNIDLLIGIENFNGSENYFGALRFSAPIW